MERCEPSAWALTWFTTIAEATQLIETWRREYNEIVLTGLSETKPRVSLPLSSRLSAS
jgi:hypothetical protein